MKSAAVGYEMSVSFLNVNPFKINHSLMQNLRSRPNSPP